MQQTVRGALTEAFFVVLGVVLALAANQWREERAAQRQADSALASILEEMQTNQAVVADSLDYHSQLLEMIRTTEQPTPRDFTRGFIAPAAIFRTAWQAASQTGALENMEYATVLELSRVYASQERYEHQARVAGEIIYRELFTRGIGAVVDKPANLAALIATFSYREQELLGLYEGCLATLAGRGIEPLIAETGDAAEVR